MFKKIKYEDGKREIYIGKFRVLKYFKQNQYLEYKISQAVFNKMLHKEGFYYFKNLLQRAYIKNNYQKLFYDFFLRSQRGEELVFIDAGAHAGVFSV